DRREAGARPSSARKRATAAVRAEAYGGAIRGAVSVERGIAEPEPGGTGGRSGALDPKGGRRRAARALRAHGERSQIVQGRSRSAAPSTAADHFSRSRRTSMTKTLEPIRRRIESEEDLDAVVRDMKELVAASIRQCERAV